LLFVAGVSVMCSSSGSKTDEGSGGINNGAGSGPVTGGNTNAGGSTQVNGGSGMGTGGAAAVTGGKGGNVGGSGGAMSATGGMPSVTCNGVPKLKLTPVVTDASDPILITQPNGDSRLFVVERRGVIRLVSGGKVSTTPFADFRNNVADPSNSERGLLGLAFHPGYAANGRFFVYYTAKGGDAVSGGDTGDLVIAEGKRSADADKAETSLKLIKKIAHSAHSNHNGGMLNFGKDGMLYAGTGDGGASGDPFKAGQDTKQALGKLLRIDVDNPNARPAGNMPDPADIHVFGIGLRNPWRWSFDRSTGDLYIGDVGQDSWEEVDYVKAADIKAGINFGWSTMEATHCYNGNNCNMMGKILPVVEYVNPPGNDARSVTGGFIYRGSKIPCLVGRYIYADQVKNTVFSFVINNGKATDEKELTADLTEGGVQIGDVAACGEYNTGELYLVARAAGRIYRIEAQ